MIPPRESALFYGHHTPVRITDDPFGGMGRIGMHHSQGGTNEWLKGLKYHKAVYDLMGHFVLVDVGANVGFFTRQVYCTLGDTLCQASYSYEPDPDNFVDMRFNLTPWNHKAQILNYGLWAKDEHTTLYRDVRNCGNYSLLQESVSEGSFSTIMVEMRSAFFEPAEWLKHKLPILYKSDIQGLDEHLATLFPDEFWEKCYAAMIEIWHRVPPTYNIERWRAIMDSFPNKMFMRTQTKCTAQDVIDLPQRTDQHYEDLLM